MSLRGYGIDKEVGHLLTLLNGHQIREHRELDPSPWKFRHSLCWWTARALGFVVEGVDKQDEYENESLMQLHAKLESLFEVKTPAPEVEAED